ncbi:ribosome maturation factor RimM [Ancylobacter dichloromethanicus]|uniref:Ribosome maturation factor RimM n=1 Tax=Ancylobacter dichloromethanicus TaxID=518825 RepID=A0A9W6J7Q0_9HYPH|nr:ribosome maturation factor RimM [Ancylobacter dichloromethanicus]MBS7555573.1 ribosome maturation factor RimM [Ancylobacter dichloromethanicus]GLK70775.1 ribosome maturation factor RimM [Ancylobacter dichloromethanicus]
MPHDRILLARIGAPHGVRGEVRLFVFADDPASLMDYAPLTDEAGARIFRIGSMRPGKEHFVARLEGVDTREAAEALTNAGIYIARDLLPEPDEEDDFYHADLIGLAAVTTDGAPFGKVVAVHDFGAGDILEIAQEGGGKGGGRTLMLPFTKAVVPGVDLKAGRLTVDPGEWVREEAPPPDADQG